MPEPGYTWDYLDGPVDVVNALTNPRGGRYSLVLLDADDGEIEFIMNDGRHFLVHYVPPSQGGLGYAISREADE